MTSQGTQDLFLTSCYRSGSTLFEKLLHANPSACVASQPFPILFIRCKQSFLEASGLERRYPLGHLFLESSYSRDQFNEFLDRHVLDAAAIDAVFEDLSHYAEGLWTPEILGARGRIRPGRFLEVYRSLNRVVAELFPKRAATHVGSKEVLCEEYVPYLLDHGTACAIIIRDPRDMIASLNYRERDNRTGANRPVLFSLRAWRKSVAVAFACSGRERFARIRYEDLIADPAARLDAVAELLGLTPYPPGCLDGELLDQHGVPWRGNSSFRDHRSVSGDSVGRFASRLPAKLVAYIEACCGPEMQALGYERSTEATSDGDDDAIRSYRDPFEGLHPAFPAPYGSAPEHIEQELERRRRLGAHAERLSLEDARHWFVDERAYEVLRAQGA